MKHARADYNRRIQDSENLIPDDEPVFLIRGQDVLAPDILDAYVEAYITNDEENYDENITIAVSGHANAIRQWQKEHPNKIKAADMDNKDMVY